MKKVCKYCENKFEYHGAGYKDYCSKKCYFGFYHHRVTLREFESNKKGICLYCKAHFKRQVNTKKYCSPICYEKHSRLGLTKKEHDSALNKKCFCCSVNFRAKHINAKYCSDDCAKEAHNKKVAFNKTIKLIEKKLAYQLKECPVCAKRFFTGKSITKKFCSKDCLTKANIAKNQFYYTVGIINKGSAYKFINCMICTKSFFVNSHDTHALCCSIECRQSKGSAKAFYNHYNIKKFKREIDPKALAVTGVYYLLLKQIKK